MSKPAKQMSGREAFYTRLAIYLHIFKHQSRENLTALFGTPESTIRGWVKEFSRPRLESILKNFHLAVVDENEVLSLEGDTIDEIRQLLMKQARNGSTPAAKILLELGMVEKKPEEEGLTIETAAALLRQWYGPSKCSKCGHEDAFRFKRGHLSRMRAGEPN